MENADLQTEQALSTAAGFSVKPTNESTRLSYDDLSTTFSDGDSVGCIICTMSSTSSTDDEGTTTTTYAYDFVANSLWTYIADSTAFVIKKYWQVPSDDSNTTTLTLVEPTENSSSYLISYSGAKTLINSSDNLYLFFYYPYIDPEETTLQNVPSYTTTNDDETTTTYLCGPPSAVASTDESGTTTLYSYPTTTEGTSLSLTPYSWREWPLFVNSCSSTISNSMGDWMDARYLYGVNNTTTGNINIQFKHRTAAICINAATDISNVKIVLADNTETTTTTTTEGEGEGQQEGGGSSVKRKADDGSTEGGSGESGDTGGSGESDSADDTESSTTETTTTTPDSIKIGQLIDLASGKLKDFDTSSTSTPDQYAYLTQSSDTLYPYKIDSQNYRFYLPAQDNWAGRLIYSYDSDAKTTTDESGNTTTTDTLRALSLKTLGNGTLVANTKYDVAIPAGPNDHTFYYWYVSAYSSSSSATITQNGTESEGVYFTNSTNKYQSSSTYNAAITVTKKDNSTASFTCQGAYELQSYGESNGYPCISFTLDATYTLTIYAWNTSSENTTSNAPTSTTSNPTIKYSTSTSADTSSTTTISFSTIDGNTGVMQGSVTLSKGSYILQKGNGANYIYLITAEY